MTITATSDNGLVEPAPFKVVNVIKEGPKPGIPCYVKVTAEKQAPAAYAKYDDVYNNKWKLAKLGIADTAFGYADGNGTDFVKLTAQIVDFYGDPVTSNVASIPVNFEIPYDAGDPVPNGTLASPDATGSIGHFWTTKTNSAGMATVLVRAYKPTKWLQDVAALDDCSDCGLRA